MADERIRLELDLGQFTTSAKEGTAALQNLAVVADQNVVPAIQHVDNATQQAARSKQNFGMTVLSASYAVQDFTSQLGTRGLAGAFAAVQNNIPQILAGLGVGAGFTGVASIAAVTAGIFADKLFTVNKALDENKKKLEEQAATQKAAVDALQAKADPGTEKMAAGQRASIDSVFAGSQLGKIRLGILSGVLGGTGGSDMTRQEIDQLTGAESEFDEINQGIARTGRVSKQRFERRGELEQQINAIKQQAAERRVNRLLSEIGSPNDKVRRRALTELRNIARTLPPETLPPNFAAMVDEILKANTSVGAELTAAGAENERIWRDQMGVEAGAAAEDFTQPAPNVNPLTLPRREFGEGMREAMRRQQQGMGFDDDAAARARRQGVVDPRFGRNNPRTARAAANADADVLSRRARPNALDAQGNPVFDAKLDALMTEMERLQDVTSKNQRYISRDAQRLARIRARNSQLEQQSQQLNNTGLDRGR